MARLLLLTQSARFGGDDSVLLDLVGAWPAGDSWTVGLNRTHPGLPVYENALAGRAEVLALPTAADGEPGAWSAAGAALRLRRALAGRAPDAVLVSSGGFPPTPLTLGFLLAARAARVPRVALTAHNEPNLGSGLRALWRGLRGKAAAACCDALVSVSADCAGKIAAACGRPVEAILNGSAAPGELAPERVDAMRKELGAAPGQPLIGAIANVEARKGLRVLVEAFARLSHPSARLAIIGAEAEPQEARALRALIAQRGLESRAALAGYRPQARRFAAAFDVCVVPSLRQESFGLLAVDAMRAGRPVVATRVGGLPEVVEDGETGLLVAPGDPAALEAALRRVLGDPALAKRLGEAGRRRAQERFDAARMALDYRRILLGGPGSAGNARVSDR